MKCLYYLTPTLHSTHQISDDLHEAGVRDWFFHVISKDEAGLKKEHIHTSNYLETKDLVRDGIIGANLGFIAGVVAAALFMFFEPFGPDIPRVIYLFVAVVITLFGAWVGGLTGIDSENKKLSRFHDEIEAGKYLILIYARKIHEEAVRTMMGNKHREAKLVAVDRHFVNPFSSLRRRK